MTKDAAGDWEGWINEFQSETDRACALLGPAYVDTQLEALLTEFFVADKNHIKKMLNDPMGGAASFSNRINLAYALGFISPTELHDLNLIKKIRNIFGHELHGIDFETPKISSLCMELSAPKLLHEDRNINHRSKFVLSTVLLAQWIALRRLGIKDTKRKIHEEVKTVSSKNSS
ncbi:MAG: hypothetical protein R3C58_13430 [Parvularculaceae bacterium]